LKWTEGKTKGTKEGLQLEAEEQQKQNVKNSLSKALRSPNHKPRSAQEKTFFLQLVLGSNS